MTYQPTLNHSVTVTETDRAAIRAIRHLLNAQNELEGAGRAPGEVIAISRQVQEMIIDDLRMAARLIRQIAEGVS